jgi:hypothetical protein
MARAGGRGGSAGHAADQPHALQWAALLRDGSAVARFADLSAMLLHDSGSRFMCEAPDGRRTGQLTRFVTSQYRAKVRRLLDFRNYYTSRPALMCKEVLFEKDSDSLSYRRCQVKSAQWPGSSDAAASKTAKSVRIHADGSVSVASLDQSANLTLDPSASYFTVTYWAPVLFAETINSSLNLSHATLLGGQGTGHDDSCCRVGAHAVAAGFGPWSHDLSRADETTASRGRSSASGASGAGIEHMRVMQCYATDPACVPAAWRHPLDLALAARAAPPVQPGTGDLAADQLVETPIPAILEIEASAVRSSDMMTDGRYNELLSRASSRRFSCACVVEWRTEGLLRYLPDGSVHLTSFRTSLVHLLSVSRVSDGACRAGVSCLECGV